ncbi:MAG: hypothetical protein JNK82_37225 [Myxococcaceae bacterium]|nr:hypothetical protein [Myxococcaceae bacterium]
MRAGLLGVVAIITLGLPALAAPKKAGKKPSAPAAVSPQVEKALKLLDDGDDSGALANLLEAQKTDPAPDELWFPIGVAQRGLFRYSDAVKSFEAYVAKGKVAEKKAAAKKQIAEIKDVAAIVTLTVPGAPAEVSIDGDPVGRSPFKAPFLFATGKHTFTAKREGEPPIEKTEDLLGGASVSIVLKAPEVSTKPEPLAPPTAFVEGDPPPAEEKPQRKLSLLGPAVAAAGLVFVGGSIALSVMAASRSSDVGRLVAEGGTWDAYYDRRQAEGERFEAWSIVAGVIGALALGTGAIMTVISLFASPSNDGPKTIDDIAPVREETTFIFGPLRDGAFAGVLRRW